MWKEKKKKEKKATEKQNAKAATQNNAQKDARSEDENVLPQTIVRESLRITLEFLKVMFLLPGGLLLYLSACILCPYLFV